MKAFIVALALVMPQSSNYWDVLSDVTFQTRTEEGYQIDYPVFGASVSAIDGKEITLKGYMVPLENLLGSRYFMLSSLPFNNCFFCGGAGPETVVEVFTSESITFSSGLIEVKGVIELNNSDPDHHMYMLKEASIN
jgi:hypothetical protein